jgi:hypothetical protein
MCVQREVIDPLKEASAIEIEPTLSTGAMSVSGLARYQSNERTAQRIWI